jgi:hypothetical protein
MELLVTAKVLALCGGATEQDVDIVEAALR